MIRFAILYFAMLILFLVLVIGPVIVKNFIAIPVISVLNLQQPTGQDNNDTSNSNTGTALAGVIASTGGAAGGGGGGSTATASAGGGGATSTSEFQFATRF